MKKFRMLGVTSGIGSMMIPARFDKDLKKKIEVVGNVEWRTYYKESKLFEKNFGVPFWSTMDEIPNESLKDIDIVMGHPECGSYSILKRDKVLLGGDESDIGDFINKISVIKPKFFLMDDLYGSLVSYNYEFYAKNLPGYDIFFEPISNYNYGNIQKNRKRFFIVGARKDMNFTFVPGELEDHGITVWDRIGDLGETDNPDLGHVHYGDAMATSWKLRDDGSFSSDGRPLTYAELAEEFKKMAPGICPKYYNKKNEQKTRIGYVKLRKDGHSNVLYGGGAQGFPGAFHPETGMPLTVRERARIQGFPDEYNLVVDDSCYQTINQKINLELKATGKAMPVEFCRYATKQFLAALEEKKFEASGERYYGNIPELITENKVSYCENFGYSNQEKVCQNCWNALNCKFRYKNEWRIKGEIILPFN